MKTLRTLFAAAAISAAFPAAPALAETARSERPAPIPAQLDAREREQYRAVFAALQSQDWAGAAARLEEMRDGPLHHVATAVLYTAPGSPKVELDPLLDLLRRAPELPQAADLARLATVRGAAALPSFPEARRLAGLAGQPRRARARPIRGDAVADEIDPQIQELIVADRSYEAEALFNQRAYELSDEARTAFRQRVAWSFYLTGNDREALRLASEAARGITEWAIHGAWVAGLSAWRLGDCGRAADYFGTVGARSGDPEFAAAGHYWAARADMMCARPERVQDRLRTAAAKDETFYGLLAQSALGISHRPDEREVFTESDWRTLSASRNVRAAIALSEIGEDRLAGELLRHQARIGSQSEHEPLIHLAARLNLVSTQMYLAHNGPRGARTGPHDRYPAPDWQPPRGWRVDQALVYAHAMQESNFRPEVVSSAGARGLMQIRPGTASDLTRWKGVQGSDRLNDPVVNVDFGQAYLEYLRDNSGTGGLLPKVIAAYNAGPAPIAEWNARGLDRGDPLLYIESIPYWETRGYVPLVLRNYWVYEAEAAGRSASRRALAQGLWPRFPGLPGPSAVRVQRPDRAGAAGQD